MPAPHLHFIGVGPESKKIDELKKRSNSAEHTMHYAESYEAAETIIQGLDLSDLVLLADLSVVAFSEDFKALQEYSLKDELLFAASPFFLFDDPELRYFYWKHYPRPHEKPFYLDASLVFGRAKDLISVLTGVGKNYDKSKYSFQGVMNRWYADQEMGLINLGISAKLDTQQEIFGSTRWSAKRKIKTHWVYGHLFARYDHQRKYRLNIEQRNGKFYHLNLGSEPVAVATHQWHAFEKRESKKPAWQAWKDFYQVAKINKWNLRKEKIFRYCPNQSNVVDSATQSMLERLQNQQPLSFAHYNDGELTFIRDFLNENHNEKWFGRQQQKYDPLLAERLHEAMQFQKEGYYVGTPCHIDHPKLAKLADEIVGDYRHKIPAMSLHHNLAYMPKFLHALKSRNVYYFTNEYQDLSLFKAFGLPVNEEQVSVVPFKNSYLEFDQYKDLKFPDDAVVVMTCGMLAKILTKVWYENHQRLTVLAFGSSLDDHIQKENINFELFPSGLPLTKNLHPSRAFLFGYKKHCRECYDF